MTTDLDGLSIRYGQDGGMSTAPDGPRVASDLVAAMESGPRGEHSGESDGAAAVDQMVQISDGDSLGGSPEAGDDAGGSVAEDAGPPPLPPPPWEDGGPPDLPAFDLATPGMMAADASPAEIRTLDSATLDSATPDSAMPDSATPDSATPDSAAERSSSGDRDAGPPGLCGLGPPTAANLGVTNAPAVTGCGYLRETLPAIFVAVDPETFAASESCGACVRIESGAGALEAKVVDLGARLIPTDQSTVLLPAPGLLQLLPDGSSFSAAGNTWRFVPCPTSTGLRFTFQASSNPSYAAVLIENHTNRLSKVEHRIGSTYVPLVRTNYNYWVASNGMGPGPFTLRVTDVLSQTIEQTGIPLNPGQPFQSDRQFPTCR